MRVVSLCMLFLAVGCAAKDGSEGDEPPPAPARTWPGGTAAGRVLDGHGSAVPGAVVIAYADDAPEAVRPDRCTRWAITDGEGRFRIDLSTEAPFSNLYVEAPGHSPRVVYGVGDGAETIVALDKPRSLKGSIYDIREKPFAGATVRWLGLMDAVAVEREGKTGPDGGYLVPDLPSLGAWIEGGSYGRWFVEVRAEGMAPVFYERSLGQPESAGDCSLSLIMAEGATVQGTVLDAAAKKPLGGARVVLRSSEGWGAYYRPGGFYIMNPWTKRVLAETTTAVDGTYSFAHVPAQGGHETSGLTGQLGWVEADPLGRIPTSADLARPSDRAVVDLDIRCRPGSGPMESQDPDLPMCGTMGLRAKTTRHDALAEFIVVDTGGRPVPGAFVLDMAEGPFRPYRTGEDGRLTRHFSYQKDAGPRPQRMRILATGYAVAETPEFTPTRKTPVEVRVVLAKERTIAGKARFPDGTPAVGVRVHAAPSTAPLDQIGDGSFHDESKGTMVRPTLASTFAGPDGSFLLRGLPEGSFNLGAALIPWGAAKRYPWAPRWAHANAVAAGASGVELAFDAAAYQWNRYLGLVRDKRDGRLILDFEAYLRRGNDRLAGAFDGGGGFVFEEVPDGEWSLEVSAVGYEPLRKPVSFEAALGPPPPVDLVLDRGRRVQGRVHVPPGVDLARAQLFFRGVGGKGGGPIPLSREGTYEASGLPPGEYRASVFRYEGLGRKSLSLVEKGNGIVEVTEAETDVQHDVQAVLAGSVSLSLKTPNLPSASTSGQPTTDEQLRNQKEWRLELRDSAGRVIHTMTGLKDWNLEGVDLAPGEYVALLLVPGEKTQEKRVQVTAGSCASAFFEVP